MAPSPLACPGPGLAWPGPGRARGPAAGWPGPAPVRAVQLDRQADHLVPAGCDRRKVESFDDPDARFEQGAVDFGPVSVVAAHGEVVDPHRLYPCRRQMLGGWLGDVHEVLDETAGLPAPGRVRRTEQDPFTRLHVVRPELVGGDLARIVDLDDPGPAHRRRQRHLIQPGPVVDEVHRRVHVRAAVHAHGQMGDVAVITAAQVHDPLQHDRRIIRPVRHAVPDRHRHVDPVRHPRLRHTTPSLASMRPDAAALPAGLR